MTDNRQLSLAWKYVEETGVSVFLTGKAGTGKTTFLRFVADNTRKRAIVLAPTGVAAVNARGSTIHSFFSLPLCPYLPDVPELVTEYQMPQRYRRLKKDKQQIISTLELLIIDEISMVRADILDAVDMSLRRFRHSDNPFGGVQLLMIGDVQQLSPVVTESERPFMEKVYPSPFFFHSKALGRISYMTIELTEVYRQADERFIGILNAVRDQNLTPEQSALLNSRVGAPAGDDWIQLTTHNWQADSINDSRMDAIPLEPRSYTAEVSGDFPENMFPAAQELVLKEGARVMFLRNDPDGRFYNGKIGTVTSLEENTVEVADDSGAIINVERHEWENLQYEMDEDTGDILQTPVGVFRQFPLRPAWAITIHKSQGLTFDHVVIDAGSAFAFGQVYVALSRCRSLEGISLARPISPSLLMAEPDVAAFERSFPTEESVAANLDAWRERHIVERMLECFSFKGLLVNMYKLRKIWREHFAKSSPGMMEKVERLTREATGAEEVAARFRRQISSLSGDHREERVKSAAKYFGDIIGPWELQRILEQRCGNEEANKAVKAIRADIMPLWRMHKATLEEVAANGFNLARYQEVQTLALLGK